MTLSEAVSEIRTFWQGEFQLPQGAGDDKLNQLQKEFGTEFPTELQEYIRDIVPASSFSLETIGNPMVFYGSQSLGIRQEGYSFNPDTGESIPDWPIHWFLFADEGADPVIIDISTQPYSVKQAVHGAGEWSFSPIADSIAQFILCCAALHHAMTHWGWDIIDDDNDKWNLAEDPAIWLFPRMKEWAGKYYTIWCGEFDNH
jgi:SMI1 / KNR4 family (SUKH-1)